MKNTEMKIRFTCLPGYEDIVPKPTLAGTGLPTWLKSMPARRESEVLAGAPVRTLKQCPPFVDAMRAGILFPLAADLHFAGGELTWDWSLPPQPDGRATRSPIGVHVPEQAVGMPGLPSGQFALKFNNFWTVHLPEGWSMLFTHPANRTDLPFRTLTGQVDVDAFSDGFVHFPAIWVDPEFEGPLAAGTPVAQGWPVPRAALQLEYAGMNGDELARHQTLEDGLQADPGLYRKRYRSAS